MEKRPRILRFVIAGSGNISAVNGQNRARRLARQRETDKCLRDVFGENLPAQKIASEIVVLGHATRLRAFLDQGAVSSPERMRSAFTRLM